MSNIRAEVRDEILVISIVRPQARNAITPTMAVDIADQLDRLDADEALRVGVLTGTPSVFSAGMDLKHFEATGERPLDPRRGSGGITGRPPLKPIIAAVEGHAVGLGLEMVLACDLVVASTSAQLGLPEVRHGLVAAGGGAWRLPSRIPRAAAMEMLLTGRSMTADRLHELGLINRVTPDGEALGGAISLAEDIIKHPASAVEFTKQLATRSRDWSESEAFDHQRPLVADFLAATFPDKTDEA